MPTYFSWIADVVSVLAALFALFGWIQSRRVRKYLEKEQQRLSRKINIELLYDGQSRVLPAEFRRADFSRSELLGVIGMIPMKKTGVRYHIDYLNSHEFYDRLNEISEAEGDAVFSIPCTQEEIDQFVFSET